MEYERTMSRLLPPEDIEVGQYVSVLHVVGESMPWDFELDATWRQRSPVRTLWLPDRGGVPLRVVEVCLPFVLVERPSGRHRTLDVRRYRLARVSDRYGREVFKRIQDDRERKRKEEKDADDEDDGNSKKA